MVASSSASGSRTRGGGSCDGYQVRTNGARSPGPTVNSATVVKSTPRVVVGVRSSSASGPATARSVVVGPPYPGQDQAVVEADDELHRDRHAAAHALDDAHDVERLVARRHEVEDADRALGALRTRSRGRACPGGSGAAPPSRPSAARAASGRCRARRGARRSKAASRTAACTSSRSSRLARRAPRSACHR